MDNRKLYFIKIDWWNEDKDINSKFFTFASNFEELGKKIEHNFEYVNHLKIEEVNCICGEDDIFWVDSDDITSSMIEAFKHANQY